MATGVAALSVMAVVLVFGAAFRDSGPDEDPALEASLVSAIRGARDRGSFDLAAATAFAWDRVHVIPAYGCPSLVEERLGFSWPGCERSASVYQDRFQLIVFVKDRAVVRWVDHDLGMGRFEIGDAPVDRRDAILDVSTTEQHGVVVSRHGAAASSAAERQGH